MAPQSQNSVPRILWSIHRPLSHHLLPSQPVATSVFARRGCLLPILATRCEKFSRMVSERERHVPTIQPSTPTQLRVKPATSITTSPSASPAAYICTTTVDAAPAGTTPKTNTATTAAAGVTTNTRPVTTNQRASVPQCVPTPTASPTPARSSSPDARPPAKPITAPITSEMAPHANAAHFPTPLAKPGTDRHSKGLGKPLSPLASPQPAPSPHACNLRSNQRGHVTASKQRALPQPAVTPPSADVAPRAHTPAPTAPPAVALSGSDVAPRMASPEGMRPLSGQPATPSHPDREPWPTVTLSNNDVAPYARTPATGATSDQVPTASVPTKCNPATYTPAPPIVHGLRDLSGLHSGSPNPWGSLSRRRQHSYAPRDLSALRSDAPWRSLRRRHCSQKPSQTIHQNHHSFRHRPKISMQTSLNPILSPSTHVFETITHPFGIGPMKPVFRVPARMATDTPANLTPPVHHTIVKSTPSLLPLHSAVAVRCQCGQLVRVSDALQTRNISLHHTLRTFISNFISPFSFPSLFFARFMFS